MKINNIGPNNAINTYNDSKKKITIKASINKADTLQISTAGRNLSNLSIDNYNISSPGRVEAVKKQVEQGTYKPSAAQIAQKMLDSIKGREI